MALMVFGEPKLVAALENLLRIYFPNRESSQLALHLKQHVENGLPAVSCIIDDQVFTETAAGTHHWDSSEQQRLAKVAFVKAMNSLYPEVRLPWGILTGVRPTKIVHRLFDQGFNTREAEAYISGRYLVAPDKSALVVQVAELQRKYLLSRAEAKRLVSVYIGIPFCPSRCLYCSFPSSVGNSLNLQEYVNVLSQEIAAVGKVLKERSLGVQSLYLGGGTPTILSTTQLSELLALCYTHLIGAETLEVTVEAGRPDTLDEGKLALLKHLGVGRISINPQTMQDKTLERIGRNHTAGQIVQVFNLAREVGFCNINMDIILGLPGETLQDVELTLERLGELDPDSLTVHALAIKRAASLKEQLVDSILPLGQEVESMQQAAFAKASDMGLQPYYLYRQKQILGNLENVGYAKPGKESVYNIQIMEERQSIIALGAGSASKLVNPQDWSLTNLQNPKQPAAYYHRWQELLQEKIQLLDSFNGLA